MDGQEPRQRGHRGEAPAHRRWRVPGWVRKVGRGMRRAADPVPVTPLGIAVGAAAAFALERFAYGKLDLVLLVVGYGAAGLVALSVLHVAITALVLKLRGPPARSEEPRTTETHRVTPTGFSLRALRWLPLLELRWSWESPQGMEVRQPVHRGRLEEEVVPRDRGEIRGVRRRIVVEDTFGLARAAFRHDDRLALDVLPSAGALRRVPVLSSLAGGDEYPHPMGLEEGDRLELRRYVPGDPARFIHWKVFGRTRKLMVRVPERALSRARRIVAYLAAGPEDDASAGAARVAVESGALGTEWTFSADGTSGADAADAPEARRLIVESIAARERGGEELEPFLERAERSGPATAIVFVPPRPGPWLERVAAVARRRQGRLRVIVTVDGVVESSKPSFVRRALTRVSEDRHGTSAEALDQVLRTLGAARCEVTVFDRVTGRQLSDVHRAAMRAREGEGHGRGQGVHRKATIVGRAA